ncbi:Arm DNA-binding domain-containing protein [Larkinella sp. GY13]|uniref:Arm DNA-binding domain-containing protein n=1 Tax=Larkinella sp. GY13 TaxID=3453720 RepID=UPI003EE9C243
MPTVAVILDTSRQKENGTYPLKLRITFQRANKYYAINYDLLESGWSDVRDKSKTRRELREIRERIAEFENRLM